VIDFNADDTSTSNTGQFILALDIKAFADPDRFRASIDTVWDEMKSAPKMTGVSEIRLPGERLDKVTRERTASGIPLAAALKAQLDDLAARLGIEPL
jgi:LDH2 family malate/lactate/ureidoglycolate dehydrogenase